MAINLISNTNKSKYQAKYVLKAIDVCLFKGLVLLSSGVNDHILFIYFL